VGTGEITVVAPSGYFRIRNGVISSSDGRMSGAVLDNFGNVRFTYVCWDSTPGATWTGIVNALSSPALGGGGRYVCPNAIGGSWRIYNPR
jgi:hypothetical protein